MPNGPAPPGAGVRRGWRCPARSTSVHRRRDHDTAFDRTASDSATRDERGVVDADLDGCRPGRIGRTGERGRP